VLLSEIDHVLSHIDTIRHDGYDMSLRAVVFNVHVSPIDHSWTFDNGPDPMDSGFQSSLIFSESFHDHDFRLMNDLQTVSHDFHEHEKYNAENYYKYNK
jgi:hypothetical protein